MTNSNRFTMVVAVHLFLIKDSKVLLTRRFNTGYEDGNFSVPAGHVDGNETCTHAIIREAKEEVGIKIEASNLRLAHVMHRRTNRESTDFFFVCEKWSGTPTIMEPDKSDAMEWFSVKKLPKNTIEYIRAAIQHVQTGKFYSEFGW